MSMDEDKDGFAAEYVLGTLDADERAQADALILRRRGVRRVGARAGSAASASSTCWSRRSSRRRRSGTGSRPRSPSTGRRKRLHLPEVAAPARSPNEPMPERRDHRADAAHAALARPYRDHRRARGVPRRHRAGARIPARRAAARLAPEARRWSSGSSRSRSRWCARSSAKCPAPRPAQLVAVFQKDEQSPEFILTVDVEKRTLTVRTVAAQRQPDRDFQIWIQPRPDVPPESLGLRRAPTNSPCAPRSPRTIPAVIGSATYGISLEPVGGSPTGRPTGPAIHAKLVQATP